MTDLFDADVRTEADFVQHAERIRPQILPRGISVVRLAGPPLKALYEAAEQLRTLEGSNRGNRPLLAFWRNCGMSRRLLPPDFLVRYDEETAEPHRPLSARAGRTRGAGGRSPAEGP